MPRNRSSDTTPAAVGVRIDKWLWAARFYKTRSIAATAIDAGHVRIDGLRCKPSHNLRVGERISLKKDALEREVMVRALSTLRGPALLAQTLYVETDESVQRRLEAEALRKLAPPIETSSARPTKRDRRDLERWREQND